jgi:hypothetical protein
LHLVPFVERKSGAVHEARLPSSVPGMDEFMLNIGVEMSEMITYQFVINSTLNYRHFAAMPPLT